MLGAPSRFQSTALQAGSMQFLAALGSVIKLIDEAQDCITDGNSPTPYQCMTNSSTWF